MNCRDCEDLLQRRLDGELVAPAALAEHLVGCATCRELFAAAKQLERGLGLLIPPQAPAMLSRRIVTLVMAERRRRVWRHYAAAGLVAAACLLIAFLFFTTRPAQTPYAPVIVEAPKTPPVIPVEPPLRDTVKEGRDALDQLTNKVFAKVDEQAGVMGDALVPLQVSGLDIGAKSHPPTTRPGIAIGLQAVTATARRGLSFMFRETPASPDR